MTCSFPSFATGSRRAEVNAESAADSQQIQSPPVRKLGGPRPPSYERLLHMYAELRGGGHAVNHKRVGRFMRLRGIRGASRRRKWRTTTRAPGATAGARPGGSQLRRVGAGPALGRQHHLHPRRGRVPVPGGGAACVEPPRGRLGHGAAHEDCARAAGAGGGARAQLHLMRPPLQRSKHEARLQEPGFGEWSTADSVLLVTDRNTLQTHLLSSSRSISKSKLRPPPKAQNTHPQV
jgi:hypothetical protein